MPFCCGPRTACKFAARVAPFFAGHNRITGAGTQGLILASAPGVSGWVTPFCPFLAKTGGSRWDFSEIYFAFSSTSKPTVYMSLSTGVYFASTTADQNDWQSFSPGIQSTACRPPQRHYIPPYSRVYSRLSPSNAAALTRRCRPPLRSP